MSNRTTKKVHSARIVAESNHNVFKPMYKDSTPRMINSFHGSASSVTHNRIYTNGVNQIQIHAKKVTPELYETVKAANTHGGRFLLFNNRGGRIHLA